MKTGKMFLGILIGTTAGALMGMLYAPQKGVDSRKKISETGKKYADSVKKKFDNSLEGITKKLNKVKKDVDDLSYRAKKKAEKIKKENGIEVR